VNRLSQEQIDWIREVLDPADADEHIALGIPPLRGADDGEEESTDADSEDNVSGEAGDDSDADTDGDKDDDKADDAATREFLADVVKIPEIQVAIREAARAGARATGEAYQQLKGEILAAVEDRLEEVTDDLSGGKITRTEAKRRAKRLAKAAVDDLAPAEDEEDEEYDIAADESSDALTARERRIRERELQATRRELLAAEDGDKIIPELVRVDVDSDDAEGDLEDSIEESKEVYKRVRRKIIADLRSQGWRAPRDRDDDDDSSEEDDEVTARRRSREKGPETRDPAKTRTNAKERRKELRRRFAYANPDDVA
jgi:hypothetical protein